MKRIKLLKWGLRGCWGIAVGCVLMLAVFGETILFKMIAWLAIAMLIGMMWIVQMYHKRQYAHIENTVASSISQFYRLKRHDWLNDLQLIFAYLKLNKIDKLLTSAENMKAKLDQEGQLLKLEAPILERYLLQSIQEQPELQLYVKIEDGLQLQISNKRHDQISRFLMEIIHICEQEMMTVKDKERFIHLQLVKQNNDIVFELNYLADLKPAAIEKKLKQAQKKLRREGELKIVTKLDKSSKFIQIVAPMTIQ